jgi:hypothetical protein
MRLAAILLTASTLALAAARAQERPADPGQTPAAKAKEPSRPPTTQDEDQQKLKKLLEDGGKVEKGLKDAGKERPPGAGDDKAKDLLARVAKNLEAAEDRLKNQDPGDHTQKLQDEVVKDLTELLKQQQKQQQQQQQQSASSSSSQSKGGTKGGKKMSRRPKGAKDNSSQQAKAGQQPKDGDPQPKKDPASGGAKNAGKDKKPGDASASKSGGGGKDSQAKGGATADLFRDVWGHLPEAKRLEMDAYSRERLMPAYEELLRQYYRAIAEQNRRKGE